MAKLLELLEELQVVDLKLRRMREFIDNFENYQQELEREREEVKERLEQEKKKLEEMKKLRMKKELDLQEGEEHIKKCSARLYTVKSNREYEATLKEIEEQKEKNSQLETELLLLYDQLDQEEEKIKQLKAEIEQEFKILEQKEKELKEKLEQAKKQVPEQEKEREELVAQIPSEAYETYQLIQQKLGDPALTRVIDEVCQSCFRRIPSQMYIEVLMGDKVWTCPGCHRILIHRELDFLPEDFPY